ncbi:D-alanyl-D-alanine carboxypeptidase/D-alanyl-D-alanine endopeptidase [Aeromicrobium wangtongii]|uniref:D-alanyl-D-alanine carboxypeptidase/D-alanyl-D-alanine endopeptidase n=1 Tax=Aeromicrobium wangtongii TaxID=2969247 RepID=UPI0020170FE7|nr:D-alanyl-D-alanine carboxypeptidase/D-alanyl-D-alanine-endopeptidase [Aeromicrobium wangtongii]MCL3820299.1 D-alanyl-D-alanine carboxypeptidase/D-alanyl-D-alanine-endopeptidase [Aeromicrobium wangtongii]
MGRVTALLIPLVVAGLVVALGVTLWGRGDLNRFICDGDCGSSAVVDPEGLKILAAPPVPTPDTASPGPIDPAKVAAVVRGELGDSVLGPRVGLAVTGPTAADVATEADRAYVPASTTKLLTGFAALATIDPDTRFATSVVRSGDGIVLVGGGDPYLATKPPRKGADRVYRADLTTLAKRTAAALKETGTTAVTLGYDASLFTGPDASPGWEPSYVTANIVTPVSALWADQGVTRGIRDREPAAGAARTFAELLSKQGIDVSGTPKAAVAGAGSELVARVRSATLAQIVETLVRVSDNEAAEVVLRLVAVAAGQPADFEGGAAAVRASLESAGISTTGLVLQDGSGLSRRNRITPVTLVEVLRQALAAPRTSELVADLPVSGFTGTLVDRFAQLTAARGTVRAKTGTLSGVHSLAGYGTDADGRPVLFALMADRSDKDQPLQAQAALDRAAAAIAGCSCG